MYRFLGILLLALLCGCRSEVFDMPQDNYEGALEFPMELTLTVPGAGTRTDADFDNLITTDLLTVRLYKGSAPVGEIAHMSLTRTDEGNDYDAVYTLKGIMNVSDPTNSVESYKLMVLANMPWGFGDAGYEELGFKLCGEAEKDLTAIPMWGVNSFSGSDLLKSSATHVDVPMLRAMAKVSVTFDIPDDETQGTLTSLEMNGINPWGYLAPNGATTCTNTATLWSQGAGNVLNVHPGEDRTNILTSSTPSASSTMTFYLPEQARPVDGGALSMTVNYTVDGEDKEETVYFRDYVDDKPSGTVYDITRNHHYEFIVKSLGASLDVEFNVEDWEYHTLEYTLQAPAWLEVDKTSIDVKPGETAVVNYRTNVSTVSCASPKFNHDGADIDVFDISIEGGELRVGLNPAITAEMFDSFNAQREDFNYLDITAGKLVKRIAVEVEEMIKFLTVSPTDIGIIVRKQIQSGIYEGDFTVTVRTNTGSFTVNPTNWETNGRIRIVKEDGTAIAGSTTIDTGNDGKYELKIHYSGINGYGSPWDEDGDFSFSVSAEDLDPQTVNLTVTPARDNYVIHAKTNWPSTHIYVYQCLELPATLENAAYRSLPVGYAKGDERSAALAYSFTGNLAFKGWDADVNTPALNSIPSSGNPSRDQGFYIFGAPNSDGWEPSRSSSRYMIMNLLAEHTAHKNWNTANCDKCKNKEFNERFPGVVMIPEGDGWYRFELSALATPGKALIMFAEHHEGGSQKPNSGEPGYPLFDYPDHEGWIDITKANPAFTPNNPRQGTTNPVTPPQPDNNNYRVYIKKGINDNDGANIWFVGEGYINDYYTNSRFKTEGDYYYIEFQRNDEFTMSFQLKNGGNYDSDNTCEVGKSSFTRSSTSEPYSITITSWHTWQSGKP